MEPRFDPERFAECAGVSVGDGAPSRRKPPTAWGQAVSIIPRSLQGRDAALRRPRTAQRAVPTQGRMVAGLTVRL
jgi:hypothetical protein